MKSLSAKMIAPVALLVAAAALRAIDDRATHLQPTTGRFQL